jgi:hypothetical protein
MSIITSESEGHYIAQHALAQEAIDILPAFLGLLGTLSDTCNLQRGYMQPPSASLRVWFAICSFHIIPRALVVSI